MIRMMGRDETEIRNNIREEIVRFFELKESAADRKFVPGKTKIQYAGPVVGQEEIGAFVSSLLDGWFGVGRQAAAFENAFSRYLGTSSSVLTNSGSSANLLAIAALRSRQAEKPLKAGDEVITPACTFPTTFNAIIQNNLRPVLLDAELGTYNINPAHLEKALSEKTRAIMLPHTLGNPNKMDAVMDFAEEHGLFVIEDTADALGSEYKGKLAGSFGHMGTFSFYVAHQMTMGEGGAIALRDKSFEPIVRSLRDWGRNCACSVCRVAVSPQDFCPFRESAEKAAKGTPLDGYENRYLYSNIGYNLKPLEFQAAMGIVQLKRLPEFIKKRRHNFEVLYEEFSGLEDCFVLPEATENSKPAWFAFPLTIKEGAGFGRAEFVKWLEKCRIETRMLFAGNILMHPAYAGIDVRVAEPLSNSDTVLKNSLFLGVYPGITDEMLSYVSAKVREFVAAHK
ncbi:MAG: lipopolysaccharide biosynthesis protein RfbH [Candidatus Diapherotrites archaeon]